MYHSLSGFLLSLNLRFERSGRQISFESQLSLQETFETIAVECSRRLIHSFKRIILIEDDILSNSRQIQVYLAWPELS